MILNIYRWVRNLINEISKDELTVYAAQSSYYIIISAFPFAMLLLSLIGFFLPSYKHNLINTVASVMPQMFDSIVSELSDELFTKSVSLLSFSAVTSMWTASRGINALKRGVCRVYKTPDKKGFIISAVYSILYTIVFMGILIVTLLLQVFGTSFFGMISKYIPFSDEVIFAMKIIFFSIITTFVFALMYFFFSKRRYRFLYHIPGAILSSLCWMIFSEAYSVYIDNFANYSYIYGSLTAVVLLMLWLFFCVMILLLGAELNRIILKKKGKFYYDK